MMVQGGIEHQPWGYGSDLPLPDPFNVAGAQHQHAMMGVGPHGQAQGLMPGAAAGGFGGSTWMDFAVAAFDARGNSRPATVTVNVIDKTPEVEQQRIHKCLWPPKDSAWVKGMVHAIAETLAAKGGSALRSGNKKWVSLVQGGLYALHREALANLYGSQGEKIPETMDGFNQRGKSISDSIRDALRFCLYILFGEELVFVRKGGQGWHVYWGTDATTLIGGAGATLGSMAVDTTVRVHGSHSCTVMPSHKPPPPPPPPPPRSLISAIVRFPMCSLATRSG